MAGGGGDSAAPQPRPGERLGGCSPSGAFPSSGTFPATALRRPRLPPCSPQEAPAIALPRSALSPLDSEPLKKNPPPPLPAPPALRFPPGAGPRRGAVGVSGAGGESAWGGLGREESAAAEQQRLRGGGGRARWRRWASSECRQGRGGRASLGPRGSGRGGFGAGAEGGSERWKTLAQGLACPRCPPLGLAVLA